MLVDRDDNLRNLIIEKSAEQFFNYGFANTTTQQIATELEISKKTLYKYFRTKEELLLAVLDMHKQEVELKIRTVIENPATDFLAKLTEITKIMGVSKSKFAPQFMRDLQKVDRQQLVNQGLPNKTLIPYLEKLLHSGVYEGMIREDIEIKLIILIISGAFENMFYAATQSKIPYSWPEVLETIPKIFMEGILTEKARNKR